jgi:anti-sigma-K factor RskA
MLPDREADLAHPEAADWVLGTLGPAQAEDFPRHLTDCPQCRAAVAEFGELGQMLQHLPPAAEPPPGLEARTIASVLAAAKYPTPKADRRSGPEDQTATRIQPRPQLQPPAADETRVQPRPQLQPPAEPQARPEVTRLPVWRRHQGRLAAVIAVAAAIIAAAIVIPLSLGGGRLNPAQATAAVQLHATTAARLMGEGAATGRATAHQAGPSWTFQMTVHGLKVLPDNTNDVYECWWVGPGSTKAHPQLVSGGTFVVDNSGSATVTMTTGIDPRQFPTMEVTAESPGTGALQGKVLLIGQTL